LNQRNIPSIHIPNPDYHFELNDFQCTQNINKNSPLCFSRGHDFGCIIGVGTENFLCANETCTIFCPKISTALGYPIEVDKVTIHFFDEATLEGVRVKDYQGYQMIDIEKLDVDFQLKSLVQDSTQNVLDYVRLFRPKVVLVIDKKVI
jgi:hypothetical protein